MTARLRKFVLPGVLLLLMPVVGYVYLGSPSHRPPSPPKLKTSWQTEDEWLTDQTVRDVAETAVLARLGLDAASQVDVRIGGQTDGKLAVRVRVPKRDTIDSSLPAEEWIWSAVRYLPLAEAILSSVTHVASSDRPADDQFLGLLLGARTPELHDQDKIVSAGLTANPADPRLHEDAALLLGVLALREAAGVFSDIRHVLCRLASHLTVARALRRGLPPGPTGDYAEALLLVLAGRGLDAQNALSTLEARSGGRPSAEAWNRVLKLRLTQDWRLLEPGQGTLLERLEHFRASRLVFGSAAAQELFDDNAAPSPTWLHIALEGGDVATGSAFLDRALLLTLDQASTLSHLYGEETPTELELLSAVNEPPARFLATRAPSVLGWGTWAAFFQRHLAFLIARGDQHYRRKVGLKEQADRFARDADRRYGILDLHPFAVRWTAEAADRSHHVDAAARLITLRPERVPAAAWSELRRISGTHPKTRLPSPESWFTMGCPRGTSYDFVPRSWALPHSTWDIARLSTVQAISPQDYDVAWAVIWASVRRVRTGQPDSVAAASALGARLEYDLRALHKLQWTAAMDGNGPLQRRLRSTMCEISLEECFALGDLLVAEGEDQAAARVYKRAIENAPDHVTASHYSPWLVRHLVDSGRAEEAERLASWAAAVYSWDGLMAQASYLEKTGDLRGAGRVINEARERYPNGDHLSYLLGLYYRAGYVRGIRTYKHRFWMESRELFPAGLEKADVDSLRGKPEDGVYLRKFSPAVWHAGLHGGEIIVALDGWRVRNLPQYLAILEFNEAPDVQWTVWRAGRYFNVPLRSANRRFGVELTSYVPPR